MARPKLCILSLSPIHRDGRVLRQIEWAARQYEVTVIGWGHLDHPRPHVQMRTVKRWIFPPISRGIQAALMFGGRLHSPFWERWYWRKPDHQQALQLLNEAPWTLLHLNEAIALPIGIKSASQRPKAKVLFDAHEYSPDQNEDELVGRLLAKPLYTYLLRTYATRATAMITVGQGIAERYKREFNLDADVVMNAPKYIAHSFHATDPAHIRLIHHGSAMRNRQLEKMLAVLALTDSRYTLDFMLVDDGSGYLNELKARAQRLVPGRVSFKPPVAPNLITETINEYDMGLYLLSPRNFNQANALPNKFFDFMVAGLGVAIGPSIEMVRLCQQYRFGVVADSFEPEAMARRLNALSSQDIDLMKQRALDTAKLINADTEMERLMQLYKKLISKD